MPAEETSTSGSFCTCNTQTRGFPTALEHITDGCSASVDNSPVQVERSDCPIQGRADDDEATGGESDIGDAAGVFGEGDEAEAAGGVPHFDLRKHLQSSRTTQVRTSAELQSGTIGS